MVIPWGALASVGGSILSGLFGSNEADEARAFQEKTLKNQYQWKTADLRKAGLNPILASGMNTVVPSGVTAQMPDLGHSISQGLATAKQNALIEKQMEWGQEKIASEVEVNKAYAESLRASASESGARVDSGMYEVDVAYKRALIGVTDSQVKKNMQDMQESMARILNMKEQRDLLKAQIEETHSSVSLMEKEKRLKELDAQLVSEKTVTERLMQKFEEERAKGEKIRTQKEGYDLPKERNKARWHDSAIGSWFDMFEDMAKSVFPFFNKK